MMSVDNKAIIRRFYEEVWDERNPEVVDQLVSPSHALQVPSHSGSATGPEAYKSQIQMYLRGFPDLQFTIEDLIAEGEKVVCCWTMSGTHRGEFMGIPATGKRMSVDGVTIHIVTNGKIMDSYVNLNLWDVMQQLGATKASGQPQRASAP
jgi:steroid delta-isomerase-like uncharacterized protein